VQFEDTSESRGGFYDALVPVPVVPLAVTETVQNQLRRRGTTVVLL
jgi:hypothetical protein